MSICKDIQYCAIEMLKKHHINCNLVDKTKIIMLLSRYVEYMIFNMIAVVSIIAFTAGKIKLLHEHMQYLQKYIDRRCSMQKKTKATTGGECAFRGGAFNTAQFYGIAEQQYSANNATNDIMSVDWQNGIARQAIPATAFQQQGGAGGARGAQACSKLNKIIVRKINSVFKFFKISTTRGMSQVFIQLFDKYMNELFIMIKKSCKKELTYKKLESIIKKTKIMKSNNI